MSTDKLISGIVRTSDEEFKAIRELFYKRFGINLTESKRTLVEGRLNKILRKHGFNSFGAYHDFVISDQSGRALSELVNSISTNHTFFYRENEHFKYFSSKALPEISEMIKVEKSKDLRLWCAACSSGEEAHTIVMLLFDFFGLDYSGLSGGLLATDIDTNMLEKAVQGVYPSEAIEALPLNLQQKYFSKSGAKCQVLEKVRKEITFRRLNLLNESFPFKKPFHSIFCRNVMIYFDKKTKLDLVRKLCDCMVPGGYLFIGQAETIDRGFDRLEYVQPAIYRKKS